MSCCGSKRAEAQRPHLTRTSPPLTFERPPTATAATIEVELRYTGERGLSLRGPASGRVYVFATNGASRRVDARDVESLLRMRWFERA
jgi:hypothetical protein